MKQVQPEPPPGRRSSSRPASAPHLPVGGPLRDLKQLMYRLYVEAGSPPYEVIAAWMASRAVRLGKTAIGRYLTEPALPPDQSATIALAAVLAARGPREANDVCGEVRRLWVDAHDWVPLGTPIEELEDPFRFEVHRAIQVPGQYSLPVLPPYLERNHDTELRSRIARAAEGQSLIVVLVGSSSTGKTRACWEAINTDKADRKVLDGWRVWHPFDPTRPEAVLQGINQVEPRTVIWLNEPSFTS